MCHISVTFYLTFHSLSWHDFIIFRGFLFHPFPTLFYNIKTPLILNASYYGQETRRNSIFCYKNLSAIKHQHKVRQSAVAYVEKWHGIEESKGFSIIAIRSQYQYRKAIYYISTSSQNRVYISRN